jgi:exodeoxyribonuclease V beta subunit
MGFDDLLEGLSRVLTAQGPTGLLARAIRTQFHAALIDEFQDTDTHQFKIFDTAFAGRPLFLIGDPKQAIYAFRGGDIVTYLLAADTAGEKQTLGVNWRSDEALVTRLQAVLCGAELGDPRIVVHEVEAHHTGSRLAGAPCSDPFRLRVVPRAALGRKGTQKIPIDDLRSFIGQDLASEIAALLA